jgi:DNA-binding XRE family transcriptional regulator
MLALEGMMNAQRNRGMYLRVGERLAEIRKSRKISQAKLAKLLGVVEGTIQNYEHGRNEPNITRLYDAKRGRQPRVEYICRRVTAQTSLSVTASVPMRRQARRSSQRNGTSVVTEMKSRQAAKIRELGQSLIDAGFVTLDQQSEALGLARSTTWTILRASHKGSGLSAAVINRMLLSPELPPLARRKILEYTTDKLAGVYGGSPTQRRRFFARLSIKQARRATPELGGTVNGQPVIVRVI